MNAFLIKIPNLLKKNNDTEVVNVDNITDVQDFKQFIKSQVLDLKAQLESRLPSIQRHVIDNERAFIKSLKQRIISLEK